MSGRRGGPGLARWWVLMLLGSLCAPGAWAQGCYNAGNLNVSFGTVSLGGTVDAVGVAPYSCEANASVTYFKACFYLAEGPGGQANMSGVDPRWMTNYNGHGVTYTLYADPGRTQVLGPEGLYTPYVATLVVPAGARLPLNLNVYGRVGPIAPGAMAGNYQAQFSGGTLHYAWSNSGEPASCTNGSGSATRTTYFTTSATVSNSCTASVSATDLDFGSVSALDLVHDGTSTITLQCPPNTNWKLGLNDGANAVGAQRRMAGSGNDYINYELYRDAGRTQRWGNDAVGGTDTVNGKGASGTLTVYGRVPVQAPVSPGSYNDTVIVTLTY